MKKLMVFVLCIFLFTGCGNEKNNDSAPTIEEPITKETTLSLKGEESISLEYGEEYIEPGFVATSKTGEDLSENVTVEGKVKKTSGEYTITYTLKTEDEEVVKIRKVTVNPIEVTENASYVPVLMYHYFYDDTIGEQPSDANHLAKSDFINQLDYLKKNNYYFPTMKELRDYVDGKIKLPPKSIILTMDDGQESNYRIAYPLAVQYEIPITWFIVTSWTDPTSDYMKNLLDSGYLNLESHTHDMHKAGCSGMGHGGYFQCVSKTEGLNDLKTSKDLIKTTTAVAYPFGDYNDLTKEIVKEAGYSLAFTTEWGVVKPGMDPYALPRVRISAGNSLQSFINSI